MAAEVSPDKIADYAGYFPGPHAEMVVASIAAGNTAAQLWKIAQPGRPAAVLLWDKGNNVFYLAGQLAGEAARLEIAQLIEAHIRPRAIAEGRSHFRLRALSPSFDGAIGALFPGIALHELHTLFYGFTDAQPPAVPEPAVEGIRFAPIDRDLLAAPGLANVEQVRAEIAWMWPDEERFLERGLGTAALVHDQVICWCTAEYLGASGCGIGIATVPAYERRGVASATAARFVAAARRRGLTPYWECRSANIGSVRVAEKVGFTLLEQERGWAGAFEA